MNALTNAMDETRDLRATHGKLFALLAEARPPVPGSQGLTNDLPQWCATRKTPGYRGSSGADAAWPRAMSVVEVMDRRVIRDDFGTM